MKRSIFIPHKILFITILHTKNELENSIRRVFLLHIYSKLWKALASCWFNSTLSSSKIKLFLQRNSSCYKYFSEVLN